MSHDNGNQNGYEEQYYDQGDQYADPNLENDEYMEEEEELDEEPSEFLAGMAGALPWIVSILVHVGIFLVMLWFVVFDAPKPPKKVVITGTSTQPAKKPGASYTNSSSRSTSSLKTEARNPNPTKNSASTANLSTESSNVISAAGGGTGGAAGGKKGLASPGGGGPKGTFMGGGAPARNIIYLIDASGSMVDVFDVVCQKMTQSYGQLSEDQMFHVIIFADGKPKMPDGWNSLRPATYQNKREVARFLRTVETQNQTDPVQALTEAFDIYKRGKSKYVGGTLIFLLTDGAFDEPEEVIALVKKLAQGNKNIKIFTYLYAADLEEEKEAADTMQKIADITNGQFLPIEQD